MRIPPRIEREVVRLSDLTVTDQKISGITFENCLIMGPAVVVMTGGDGTLQGCTFDGDLDAILWEIPQSRGSVLGAIELESCHFIDCRFTLVGFAGPAEFLNKFRSGIAS
ncbi:hypothetical protein G9E11_01770 [Arthrobacter sp. IA7]|uniref:hypothetical protein n=1 Tax=Arthrobacter ipis TaxID=2716202 RepID=UPI001684635E|nr:hypothetical protein [Arthrobacter ipis]MBD1541001.1 hypothetical protein [Arthrobacter ipis]